MKRFFSTLAAIAGAAIVLAVPVVAHAARTRVVVAGPEGDPIVSRLHKELTAMGFEPVRVDDAAGCANGAIDAWIREMKASAAVCSDGRAASVWTVTRGGVHIADAVTSRPEDEHATDLVAVRAAEITRASLELPGGEPEAAPEPPTAPTPPKPPPTWSIDPDPVGADTTARRSPGKRAAGAPRTPYVTLGLGAAALMGADANAAALDAELALRLHRYVALSARTSLTFAGTTVSTPRHTVRVAPSLFGIGPVFALLPADAFLIPRIGGGVGAIWLRSSGIDAPEAFSDIGGPASVATTSAVTSAAGYLNAAASMRIGGPVRLTFEGLLGTTANRIVVRAEGQHIAYWGQPFGSLGVRGELMFR